MKRHTSLSFRNIVIIAALAVVLSALAHQCQAQPASAAALAGVLNDPRGYRRCKFGEIQADPGHRVCRLATWVETRNGYTVKFRAYVRPLRHGERQL